MGSARHWARNLDMYKKVPGDLLEGSKQGSIVSWLALLIIVVLFYKETMDYWTTYTTSDLYLDHQVSSNDQIRVTFNITMTDLRCDYVEVDVVSVLGNNQNVTKFIKKFAVDANGVIQRDEGKKPTPDFSLHDEEVKKSVERSIEAIETSGEEAVTLDANTIQFALNENPLVFVDFFASWCSHCRSLAPTWEILAKIMGDAADAAEAPQKSGEDGSSEDGITHTDLQLNLKLPVLIAKVDCVEHHDLCVEQKITGYPTLRLFVEGQPYKTGDYRGQRFLMDLIQFIKVAEADLETEGKLSLDQITASIQRHLNVSAEEKHWAEALHRMHHHHHEDWNPEDHPGCQLSGSLLINRVPGNFYIQAMSLTHDLVPHMTNVSHQINSLSFSPDERNQENQRGILPKNFDQLTRPVDGKVFITNTLHQAYHHYLKLVSTNGNAYQVLYSSQLAVYEANEVPEAKFLIDLSPIAIRYRRVSRHWYDYVTSLMAIIGGTFTVVGIFESGVRQAARRIERRRQSHVPASSAKKRAQ